MSIEYREINVIFYRTNEVEHFDRWNQRFRTQVSGFFSSWICNILADYSYTILSIKQGLTAILCIHRNVIHVKIATEMKEKIDSELFFLILMIIVKQKWIHSLLWQPRKTLLNSPTFQHDKNLQSLFGMSKTIGY